MDVWLALDINTPLTIGGHATCSTTLREVFCSTSLPDRSSLVLSPSVDEITDVI